MEPLSTLLATTLLFGTHPLPSRSSTSSIRTTAHTLTFSERESLRQCTAKEYISTPNNYYTNLLQPHQKFLLLKEITTYTILEDGWDGDDSLKPTADSIKNAMSYIEELYNIKAPLPKSMLNAQGEVGLYWDNQNTYIDIHFEANNLISIYARSKQTQEECFFDEIGILSLPSIMAKNVLPLLQAPMIQT